LTALNNFQLDFSGFHIKNQIWKNVWNRHRSIRECCLFQTFFHMPKIFQIFSLFALFRLQINIKFEFRDPKNYKFDDLSLKNWIVWNFQKRFSDERLKQTDFFSAVKRNPCRYWHETFRLYYRPQILSDPKISARNSNF